MRFIYIDTKGKEVPIPTVDALALRIELGAIREETRLYDEAANRWAPAGEHEVFRSLVREQQERSEGFVAPPPPAAPPPVQAAQPPPPPAPEPPPRDPNPFDVLEGPGAAPVGTPDAGRPPSSDLGSLGFDLTLEPLTEMTPAPAAERGDAEFGLHAAAEAAAASEPAARAEMEKESFDFGGFGGLLADDEEDDEEEEDDEGHDEGEPEAVAAPEVPASHVASESGLTLEGVLATAYGGMGDQESAVSPGGVDLEQPLSELPLDQAGWSPKDRMSMEGNEEDLAGHESGPARARSLDEQSGRPERSARARPAAARRSSPVPALIGALAVLAVVGGGGWLGWTKLKNRPPEAPVEAAVVEPVVALPELAPELEPRMRELGDSALADWLVAVRTTLATERGVPAEPDRAWLSGSYLADASRYASIGQYWRSFGAYLDDLEERDVEMFAAFYQARIDSLVAKPDSAGVSVENGQSMRARAEAGFLAARPDRRPVYQRLRDVVVAALGLHEFLVANEDNIEYDPAAGGASRDPVLEAVPATPELGTEMWNRVDSITTSLDALGALDLVTSDRLLALLGVKLQEVPIR